MEKLLKPIPEKHLYRVAQIKKVLKNYKRNNSPAVKIISNTQSEEMKKIKKAQKLNNQKQQVKELKKELIKNDEYKDVEMTHIYTQIKNSSLRTLSVKASTPLKNIIKKIQRTRTSFDNESDVPDKIKTKYSNLQTFFKQKSDNIDIKQYKQRKSNKENLNSSKLSARWWEKQNISPKKQKQKQNQKQKQKQPQLKSSSLNNKSARLPKIKSRTHIQFLVQQIQQMIDKNMQIIDDNLNRLHQVCVQKKRIKHIQQQQQIISSNIIANYKPWSHQSNIKKTDKQNKYLGRSRRKSLSRIYQRQIFKLSVDTFKRNSFIINNQWQEVERNIQENLNKRDYLINQSKFGKESKKMKKGGYRYSNQIDMNVEKTEITHRRIRTETPMAYIENQ